MKKLSRRAQAFADKVVPGKYYSIPEAVEILEELSSEKFKESYDISINLGVDPKNLIRWFEEQPFSNGTGKTVRVAVFAQGESGASKEAGADIVGMEELAEAVKKGLNFDQYCHSRSGSWSARTNLGPRGLMPNLG